MRESFGSYIRKAREALIESDAEFSVRKVAARIGVEPSYLSKVERDEVAPPSEATIVRLAQTLDQDQDLLLAPGRQGLLGPAGGHPETPQALCGPDPAVERRPGPRRPSHRA